MDTRSLLAVLIAALALTGCKEKPYTPPHKPPLPQTGAENPTPAAGKTPAAEAASEPRSAGQANN